MAAVHSTGKSYREVVLVIDERIGLGYKGGVMNKRFQRRLIMQRDRESRSPNFSLPCTRRPASPCIECLPGGAEGSQVKGASGGSPVPRWRRSVSLPLDGVSRLAVAIACKPKVRVAGTGHGAKPTAGLALVGSRSNSAARRPGRRQRQRVRMVSVGLAAVDPRGCNPTQIALRCGVRCAPACPEERGPRVEART